MTEELRKNFHEELVRIRKDIIKMAGTVGKMIPRITTAFLEKDLEQAQILIDADEPLDLASMALEEKCCRALALQQPMARDLRSIVSAMSINSDIERSGDLAVNVAKATIRLKDSPITDDLAKIIQKMSQQAEELIKSAMEAYEKENVKLANALGKKDDVLDKLNYECLKAALNDCTEGKIDLNTAVHITLIGRYYERIGDHAVNIGERIHYMITGEVLK